MGSGESLRSTWNKKVKSPGRAGGAARRGAESRFFDLQSRPSARSGRCSLLPFRETRLKGTKRRGEKEIDQRHRGAWYSRRPVPLPPNDHYRRSRCATHATRPPSPISLPLSLRPLLNPALLQCSGTKCNGEDGVGGEGGGGGENLPRRMAEGEKEKEWGGEEKATDGRGRTDGRTD